MKLGPQDGAMPPLKTERAGEKLWLMKVPSFLMEQLADAQAASEQIGSIRPDDHARGADHPSKAYTLQLAESSRLPREMPREFSVSMSEAPAGSYVFSEPKDVAKDGSWRLEGQIDRKGEARPKSLSSEYKSLIAKRVETANLKREIQSSFEETGASRQARVPTAETVIRCLWLCLIFGGACRSKDHSE